MSRTAGTASPAWATAQTIPISEYRKGGHASDKDENHSVFMILGLVLLLMIVFALLWFFFRRLCGGRRRSNRHHKKNGHGSGSGSSGSDSDSN
jgi:hypothetical protein